jgi:hypothetical protein
MNAQNHQQQEDVVVEMKDGSAKGAKSGNPTSHVTFNLVDLPAADRDALADAFEATGNPEMAQRIRSTAKAKDTRSRLKQIGSYKPNVVDFLIVGGAIVGVAIVWEGARYLLRNKLPNMPGILKRSVSAHTETKVINIKTAATR